MADPDDGRAARATITDRGRGALRAAAPAYLAGIDEHFARHLSEDERTVIARGLGRIVDLLPSTERGS
jgi:DNA-binding MarR family transcriptional regulator